MPKLARYSLLTVGLTFAAALFLAFLPRLEFSRMKCRTLDQLRFETVRARFGQIPLYAPDEQGRASVRFEFNLNPRLFGESIFVIFSNRVQAAVYRGPYQSQVSVPFDGGLASDESYDELEFRLLQLEQKQICTWLNERGEPYWSPGARISIDFLSEPTVDAEGLSKRFDVSFR